MTYKDFTAEDRAFCLAMEKVGETLSNTVLQNEQSKHYVGQIGFLWAIQQAIEILSVYIISKEKDFTFELYDSTVSWLKFMTLSLKKQELEKVVSNFLKEPSLDTAQKVLQAYNDLAERSATEILKDEIKQDIKAIC